MKFTRDTNFLKSNFIEISDRFRYIYLIVSAVFWTDVSIVFKFQHDIERSCAWSRRRSDSDEVKRLDLQTITPESGPEPRIRPISRKCSAESNKLKVHFCYEKSLQKSRQFYSLPSLLYNVLIKNSFISNVIYIRITDAYIHRLVSDSNTRQVKSGNEKCKVPAINAHIHANCGDIKKAMFAQFENKSSSETSCSYYSATRTASANQVSGFIRLANKHILDGHYKWLWAATNAKPLRH